MDSTLIRSDRRSRPSWYPTSQLLALPLLQGAMTLAAADALLSKDATYTVRSYSHCWPGQAVPGTGEWVMETGYHETPYVARQENGRTLIDGVRTAPSRLATWFWSQEQKRLVIEFDLQRTARIDRVLIFLNDEAQGALAERIDVSIKQGDEWQPYASSQVAAQKASPLHEVALEGDGATRLLRLQITSTRSAYFSVSEIEIWGDPQDDLPEGASSGFIATWPRRDITALTRRPDLPPRSTLRLAAGPPEVAGELEADAADAATLTDSKPETFLTATQSPATVTLTLRGPALIDRIIVWVVPEGPGGAGYLNTFNLAIGAKPGGPFQPLPQRTQNPIYPGELKQPYPVVSPDLGGVVAFVVRLEAAFWHLNAPRMRVGEIEIWGRPATAEGAGAELAWKLVKDAVAITPEPLGTPEPQYEWILSQKIRGGYTGFHQFSLEFLDRCKRYGLNTLLIHFFTHTMKQENFGPELAKWGAACRQRGLRFIPEIVFGSDAVYGNTQFGAFHPGNLASWTRTPCPLSEGYWENVVAQRALTAARIGPAGGIDGFCVDMEMYSADETTYPGPCFCNTCFASFIQEFTTGLDPNQVPADTRLAWAKANDLADLYARWQEREVQRICTGIQRRVHEIDPRMILSTLLHPEPLAGMTRGLGTPSRPILIFEERTYWGNVAGIPSTRRALEAAYPGLYVPGFWFHHVQPDRLADLSAVAASQAHGYWYFTLHSLRTDQELSDEYAVPEPWTRDDYWEAIAEAGRETDRMLTGGGTSDLSGREDRPRVELSLKGTSPKIDGTIDDDEWGEAVGLGPFRLYVDGAPATVPSHARILSDGESLFIAAEFTEPRISELVHQRTVRDDVLLWRDDCFELFVAPNADATVYYHFIINPDAVVYDARHRAIGHAEPVWDSHAIAAGKVLQDGWTLEVKIPLADLSPKAPEPGDVWRLNICREQRVPPGEVSCVWPTFGPFHQPDRFAELVWK